jgi:hypothetical protein
LTHWMDKLLNTTKKRLEKDIPKENQHSM